MKKTFVLLYIIINFFFPQCFAETQTHTFKYEAAKAHPRLLMLSREERKIKTNIRRTPELQVVYQIIREASDSFLTVKPVSYQKKGLRLLGVSREALTRIFYLSFSYRMSGEKQYAHRAQEELMAICSFPDWNPSHFLDVGEMAVAASIGYDWLYDQLSTDTRETIRTALIEKALIPSFDHRFNWFLRASNNWNQVCNAGMVFAALSIMEQDKEMAIKIIERAISTIHHSMNGYAPDGNYPEGYGYWGYGTTFNVLMIAALESTFGWDGGLTDYPGFLSSADYIQYMTGITGLPFNYSDCREKAQFIPVMTWFAKKTGNQSLLWNELQYLRQPNPDFSFEDARVLPLALIYAAQFPKNVIQPPSSKMWRGNGHTPVALFRTNWTDRQGMYLGVKGGRATTSHAHMDGGSFVFEALGVRWAQDLGMQEYASLEKADVKLWDNSPSGQRWNIFRYHNTAHNTLTINGQNHQADAYAPIIRVMQNDTLLGATLDLSPLFPHDTQTALRTFRLVNEEYLEITDSIQAANNKDISVRWTMVTSANPTRLNDRTIELSQEGQSLQMVIVQPQSAAFHILSNQPPHIYDAPNPNSIRIIFDHTVSAQEPVEFTVKLIPLKQ